MDHYMIWGQFAAAALLIVFSGVKLTKYGDIYSEKLGLGHAFVGAILIGWSTSLPELVLSLGTAVYESKPTIMMGNVLGSNLFNIFILVLMDLYSRTIPVLRTAAGQVNRTVNLSFIIVIAVGICLFSQAQTLAIGPTLIGYDSLVIFGIYFFAMASLYFGDRKRQKEEEEDEEGKEKAYGEVEMGSLIGKTVLVIAIIVGAGLWLSTLATQIQTVYNLEEGFVGSFFLAIISSLPEVITCFVAIRMGFPAMAVGALFGSNIFNMAIIAFCDIFYTSGGVISAVHSNRYDFLSSVVFITFMTMIAMFVLRYKKDKHGWSFGFSKDKTGWSIGFETFAIAACYFTAIYFTYKPEILKPVWDMLAK